MSNVILDGEAQLGADGVLQGWCWNPQRATERLVLEILVNERVVSAFVASRFREDLPARNIGDGYYGFVATLTKSLLDAGDNFVISARERGSGCCFWRQVSGDIFSQNGFAVRLAHANKCFWRFAGSRCFRTQEASSLVPIVSTELGALGVHLAVAAAVKGRYLPPVAKARAALLQHTPAVVLDKARNPEVAVIITAESPSCDVLSSIRAIVPTLKTMDASILLIDRGTNAEVGLATSLFRNLQYIYEPRGGLDSLLSDALKYAHGEVLIFLRNPGGKIVEGLPEIVGRTRENNSTYVNAWAMEVACGVCALSTGDKSWLATKLPIGLQFSGTRQAFERIGRLFLTTDRIPGREDVDFAIRAIRDGIELCVWEEPNLDYERVLY